LKGLPYERCAELPYIIEYLKDLFSEHHHYLDIGSGESPLPTFFLKYTKWDISCVDKFAWVRRQTNFASRLMKDNEINKRFHIIEKDFLATVLPAASYDIITNVSVIEHFDDELDIAAMKASGKLLKHGGLYILTTLINEGFYREYFVEKGVYGVEFNDKAVFYQRHYDLNKLQERIINSSGLVEKSRVYFGDYSFQCFEKVFQKTPKIASCLFRWATPFFARRFLSYNDKPVSRKDMRMNTASGVILILTK
jgi:SAM-dependent methyltransferase